jgi:hypothetical protein
MAKLPAKRFDPFVLALGDAEGMLDAGLSFLSQVEHVLEFPARFLHVLFRNRDLRHMPRSLSIS